MSVYFFVTFRGVAPTSPLPPPQSPEHAARLNEAFERLTADLEKSLELTNRDRFAQRLANFRQKVREFLTV